LGQRQRQRFGGSRHREYWRGLNHSEQGQMRGGNSRREG